MSSGVETRVRGRVTEIVLNRPEAGNALDAPMVEAILASLGALDSEACATVVFRGVGKGFCGGFDLSDLENETDASLLLRFVRIETMLQAVAALPQETVVFVHRFAFGAGADLALACRRRIAAPGTSFSFPGVRFGIALGTGRLARRIGPDAARAVLDRTAPVLEDEALVLGLVAETMEPDAFEAEIEGLAGRRGSLNPRMARLVAARLDPGRDAADMAALVASASEPGLKARIAAYAEAVAAARHGRSRGP